MEAWPCWSWSGWLVTYQDGLPITHSGCNRARRRLTSLMKISVFAFSQTSSSYPAPGRGTGYCFRAISFFLSLFLCQQHYEKTAEPICMKFSGKVWSDHGTTWLHFGSIRVNGSAGQRSVCLLSPAIAQRTGVKSVSFTRWQQGAGFVVPRTTAC